VKLPKAPRYSLQEKAPAERSRSERSPRTTLRNFLDRACPWHQRVYCMHQVYADAMWHYSRIKRPPITYLSAPDPRLRAGHWTALEKAAAIVDEMGVPDKDYVDAQFAWFDRVLGKLPYANQLTTPAALERYLEFKKGSRPQHMTRQTVAQERRYYEKQLARATHAGITLEDALRRGVLGGVLPEWFAAEKLGPGWKKKYLSYDEVEQLDGRQ
jgi:hypothetical protein